MNTKLKTKILDFFQFKKRLRPDEMEGPMFWDDQLQEWLYPPTHHNIGLALRGRPDRKEVSQ
ncbi:MAG: hypothetical protein ABJN62_11310 [Halioglobus sp.]